MRPADDRDQRSPLLPPNRITTLVGPPGLELAALTAAIAVSYRSGLEIMPGWAPSGPREVTISAYDGNWVDWRSMVQHIADNAHMPPPMIDIHVCRGPRVLRKPVERDPDVAAVWEAGVERDVGREFEMATASGHDFQPCLEIVFGLTEASGGGDGSKLGLYRHFRRGTTLMVGGESAFTEDSWGEGEEWAGSFGPVLRLPQLRQAMSGLSEFLARTAATYVPVGAAEDDSPESDTSAVADAPTRGDAAAFLAEQGVEAMRAIVTDSQSVKSRQLKAMARRQGVTPGRLWHAAKVFADDAQRRYELAFRSATDSRPLLLHGYAARFGEWHEVHSRLDGNYLQQLAPGCFAQTIREDRALVKCCLQHGRAAPLGYKALGPLLRLEEDDAGLAYEVELLLEDVEVRELVPWLATGLYGGSITFIVVADEFILRPGKSSHNPRGIPEQTVTEIRLAELGPVHPPAFKGTTAAIRKRD